MPAGKKREFRATCSGSLKFPKLSNTIQIAYSRISFRWIIIEFFSPAISPKPAQETYRKMRKLPKILIAGIVATAFTAFFFPDEAFPQDLVIDGYLERFDDEEVHVFDTVTVGVDLPNSRLEVGTNTLLLTSSDAFIGLNGTSIGYVSISGANARWDGYGDLKIGNEEFSQGYVNVLNGGKVTFLDAVIGFGSGSFGEVNVIGSGSRLDANEEIFVGGAGNGVFNILGAGTATSVGHTYIGNSIGSTGFLTISGEDSRLFANEYLFVGLYGNGDLQISEGGGAVSENGSIGSNSGTTGTATIDGQGSFWEITEGLVVGGRGTATLTVTNGGRVQSGSFSYISNGEGSNGYAEVIGSGSEWIAGGWMDVGSFFGVGELLISDGGKVTSLGGTVGYGPTATGFATIESGGSWNVSDSLEIGAYGNGEMEITGGGKVINQGTTFIGRYSEAEGSLLIDGTGSELTNTGSLRVGYSGYGEMIVTNGGRVSNLFGNVAFQEGSQGRVEISGSGSSWVSSDNFNAGYGGYGEVFVENGGRVSTRFSTLGFFASGIGIVEIDGANSVWSASSNFVVGNSGTGELTISNGALVGSVNGTIASATGSVGSVEVQSGGHWLLSGTTLIVGRAGEGNISISYGGKVTAATLVVGQLAGSNGLFEISGSDSRLDGPSVFQGSDATIGGSGFGWAKVTDQAGLVLNSLTVGSISGGEGYFDVTGSGTSVAISQDATIGGEGTGEFTVTQGATGEVSGGMYLGSSASSFGAVTVSDTDSLLTVQNELLVGNGGEGLLNVSNQGRVASQNTSVGSSGGSEVNVDGYNSAFRTQNLLTVGGNGNGSINVSNGAFLFSQFAVVGQDGVGQVSLSGEDTVWTNDEGGPSAYIKDLKVGVFSEGFVSIKEGATLLTQNTSVGQGTNDGFVLVEGTGSKWTYSGNTIIGDSSKGRLDVVDNGVVSATFDGNNLLVGLSSGVQGQINAMQGGRLSGNNLALGLNGTGIMSLAENSSATFNNVNMGITQSGSGLVTVSGPGSQLTAVFSANLGHLGYGQIDVGNGGVLDVKELNLGFSSNDDIRGRGILNVFGGGSVNSDLKTNVGRITYFDEFGVPLYSEGGEGRLTIFDGGVFEFRGQLVVGESGFLDVQQGGTLINNGLLARQEGGVILGIAGGMKGTGSYQTPLTLTHGGELLPGASPGTMSFTELTILGDTSYEWEIDSTGNQDLVVVSDSLIFDINDGESFLMELVSLGALDDWDPAMDRQWMLFSADSIQGFNESDWIIDHSGFSGINSIRGGHFSVFSDTTGIVLQFTAAIPEPSSFCLVCLSIFVALKRGRRKAVPY